MNDQIPFVVPQPVVTRSRRGCTVFEGTNGHGPDRRPKPYDLVCFPGYMLIGFKAPAVVDPAPITIDGKRLEPLRAIQKIGKKSKGRSSAGWSELEMIPPAFLSFAGTFDDLVLFHSHRDENDLQFCPAGPGTKQKHSSNQ